MADPIGVTISVTAGLIVWGFCSYFQRQYTPDGLVLRQLKKAGSDITKEHEIEFFFISPSKESATNLLALLEKEVAGLNLSLLENDGIFVISAKKTIIPSLSSLLKYRKLFNNYSSRFGSKYDGWGSSIEN